MIRMYRAVSVALVAVLLTSGAAIAQDHHDDDHYVRHDEWRKGIKISHDDWNRGRAVDYRHYHLQAPPRGYEWRQVDGNYVLAAAATGLISSVIVASTIH